MLTVEGREGWEMKILRAGAVDEKKKNDSEQR